MTVDVDGPLRAEWMNDRAVLAALESLIGGAPRAPYPGVAHAGKRA